MMDLCGGFIPTRKYFKTTAYTPIHKKKHDRFALINIRGSQINWNRLSRDTHANYTKFGPSVSYLYAVSIVASEKQKLRTPSYIALKYIFTKNNIRKRISPKINRPDPIIQKVRRDFRRTGNF